MEGKTHFRGAYRLPGTGIVECLEIIDVGCNVKQFDLTDTNTHILQIYATGKEGRPTGPLSCRSFRLKISFITVKRTMSYGC